MTAVSDAPRASRALPRTAGGKVDVAAIALVAFALRFGIVALGKGGPRGIFGYDAGVYYAGADALIHGRVPYSQFVFLHPPGIMIALAPFAAIGRLTTDHIGYMLANTAVNVLAAVNAILVWQICRRLGFTRIAALAGGMFYAIWWGAIDAELGVRLEPLGNAALLLGLFLLLGRPQPSPRRLLGAGAALGAACCVKIWFAAPFVAVLVWQLAARSRRKSTGYLAAGAVTAGVVIAGPFFVRAPHWMWQRVIVDQVGRRVSGGGQARLDSLAAVHRAFPSLPASINFTAIGIMIVVFVGLGVCTWRVPQARLVAILLFVQALVLVLSPSYFTFYSDYLAVPLALAVGATAQAALAEARSVPWRTVSRVVAGAASGLAVVVTAGVTFLHSSMIVSPFPGAGLARAARHVRCLMTDSPSALILSNHLSKNLANGCRDWIDVTGRTYDVDEPKPYVRRSLNTKWQRDLRHYLLSGDAVVVIRSGTGVSRATSRALRKGHILFRGGGVTMYSVEHPTAP